mgnify:CR=1 FL=1
MRFITLITLLTVPLLLLWWARRDPDASLTRIELLRRLLAAPAQKDDPTS